MSITWVAYNLRAHFCVLARFPSHAGLLRLAIGLAQASCEADRLDALLTRLVSADRSPATVALVHRLRDADLAAPRGDVRVAMLTSYMIDALDPFVDLACRTLALRPRRTTDENRYRLLREFDVDCRCDDERDERRSNPRRDL